MTSRHCLSHFDAFSDTIQGRVETAVHGALLISSAERSASALLDVDLHR